MIWSEGLTRTFPGGGGVRDLDLDVQPGEVFGFLGPNGAGKSTTVRVLTTLLQPDHGQARVAGYDPVLEAREVRRRIGYVPDECPVYPQQTANEFLTLFARLHRIPRRQVPRRVADLLRRVGLRDVQGKPTGTYSKGMKQRLGIARALLGEPEVLFLDEPASGLDPLGRKGIRDLIRSVASDGTTVFLCSHDLAEVQAVCGRAAVLRSGRVVRDAELGRPAGTALRLQVEGPLGRLRDELERLPNLRSAQRRGGTVRLSFDGPVDRFDVARSVQRAGAVLLAIDEETLDLEAFYKDAMRGGL